MLVAAGREASEELVLVLVEFPRRLPQWCRSRRSACRGGAEVPVVPVFVVLRLRGACRGCVRGLRVLVAVVQEASEELSSCWLVHVVLVTVVLEVNVALVAVVLGVTVVQVHEVWRFPWCLPRLCKRPRNA